MNGNENAHLHNRVLFSGEEKINHGIWRWMGEIRNSYTEWGNPDAGT